MDVLYVCIIHAELTTTITTRKYHNISLSILRTICRENISSNWENEFYSGVYQFSYEIYRPSEFI